MLSGVGFVVGRRAASALLPVSDTGSAVYSQWRIRACAREPMTAPAGGDIVRL
jgi:hypothetical protein